MKQLQFRFKSYIFAPTLFGALLTIICIVLFIKFGLWQYHKATIKQDIQARYNAAVTAEGLDFPATLKPKDEGEIEALKYQKVKATGYYLPQYTVLLDNQTEQNRVGYHVITPLKLAESDTIVLVNRGWIVGNATHTELPDVSTPQSLQNISGQVWVPSTRYFTLEKKVDDGAGTQQDGLQKTRESDDVFSVVQNLDLAQYRKMTNIAVSPLVIKLDAKVAEGGFVRNWQVPAARISTHIGYAFQWFGFALASLLIFLYMSIRKVENN
jgi:surfeit locus 1 family protein